MKKGLKISFIVFAVLVGVIVLDTLQAKIFDNSPLLKIRENLDEESIGYIDKGLLVNHYQCNNEKVTTWKGTKFSCSVKENNPEDFDFYLMKHEGIIDLIRFKDYFTMDNRRIYLSGNIKEFYIKDPDGDLTLKKYLSTVWQTLDDSIKNITDKLDKVDTYRDGGTTVYKSKDKDITLISCKKTDGNNNIYIGDYSLEYADDLCE